MRERELRGTESEKGRKLLDQFVGGRKEKKGKKERKKEKEKKRGRKRREEEGNRTSVVQWSDLEMLRTELRYER